MEKTSELFSSCQEPGQDIITKAQGGDRLALEIIFRCIKHILRARARRITENKAFQEDLVQEVYRHLLEDDFRILRSYEPRPNGSFFKFMKAVSHRLMFNYLQKEKPGRSELLLEDDSDEITSGNQRDAIRELSEEVTTMEQRVRAAQNLLGKVLPSLNPKLQRVIKEIELNGISRADFAGRSGLAATSVATQVYTGREAIRKKLRTFGVRHLGDAL